MAIRGEEEIIMFGIDEFSRKRMDAVEDVGKGAGDLFKFDPFDITGGRAAKEAAKDVEFAQTKAGNEAISREEAALEVLRGDLGPFREAGTGALEQFRQGTTDLQGAISDPTAGVINNPFFQALAAEQDERLLASQAARGKVGSGGTNDELIRQQLLLGNQFSQQNIGNIQNQIQNELNLATLGSNAAARTGTAALNSAENIGGILGNIANVQGSSIIAQHKGERAPIDLALNVGSSLLGGSGIGRPSAGRAR